MCLTGLATLYSFRSSKGARSNLVCKFEGHSPWGLNVRINNTSGIEAKKLVVFAKFKEKMKFKQYHKEEAFHCDDQTCVKLPQETKEIKIQYKSPNGLKHTKKYVVDVDDVEERIKLTKDSTSLI